MRILTALVLLVSMTGCSLLRKKTPIAGLNGVWVPQQQEMGGTPIPKGFMENMTLTISDSRYLVIAGSKDRGKIKYHENKMDIYGRKGPNAGKHLMAIFKYDGDELTICYNLKGDGYPKDFETKSNPMYLLSRFKRSGK